MDSNAFQLPHHLLLLISSVHRSKRYFHSSAIHSDPAGQQRQRKVRRPNPLWPKIRLRIMDAETQEVIRSDVDFVLQQSASTEAADVVEQLSDVVLSYAEGELSLRNCRSCSAAGRCWHAAVTDTSRRGSIEICTRKQCMSFPPRGSRIPTVRFCQALHDQSKCSHAVVFCMQSCSRRPPAAPRCLRSCWAASWRR